MGSNCRNADLLVACYELLKDSKKLDNVAEAFLLHPSDYDSIGSTLVGQVVVNLQLWDLPVYRLKSIPIGKPQLQERPWP